MIQIIDQYFDKDLKRWVIEIEITHYDKEVESKILTFRSAKAMLGYINFVEMLQKRANSR